MQHRDVPRVSREQALAHPSRVRLLEELAAEHQGLDASELAQRVGLHVNTVRSHLRRLEEADLVRRHAEPPQQPGRPRQLYRAAPDARDGGAERYRLMAQMLASYIASSVDDPSAAAEETGRQWGRHLTPAAPPFAGLTAAGARARLLELLDQLGFAPRQAVDGASIDLRHCPFRDVAEAHPEVACALHLGLMRGALGQLDAPLEVSELLPFVDVNRCVARLRER